MKKSELREIIREELLNEGKDGGIIQKADKKFLEKKIGYFVKKMIDGKVYKVKWDNKIEWIPGSGESRWNFLYWFDKTVERRTPSGVKQMTDTWDKAEGYIMIVPDKTGLKIGVMI